MCRKEFYTLWSIALILPQSLWCGYWLVLQNMCYQLFIFLECNFHMCIKSG